jgi:hypothetical protein
MYKLIYSTTAQTVNSVLRLLDDTYIPFDPANTDYQAYLAWCEEGNVALPADEVK